MGGLTDLRPGRLCDWAHLGSALRLCMVRHCVVSCRVRHAHGHARARLQGEVIRVQRVRCRSTLNGLTDLRDRAGSATCDLPGSGLTSAVLSACACAATCACCGTALLAVDTPMVYTLNTPLPTHEPMRDCATSK